MDARFQTKNKIIQFLQFWPNWIWSISRLFGGIVLHFLLLKKLHQLLSPLWAALFRGKSWMLKQVRLMSPQAPSNHLAATGRLFHNAEQCSEDQKKKFRKCSVNIHTEFAILEFKFDKFIEDDYLSPLNPHLNSNLSLDPQCRAIVIDKIRHFSNPRRFSRAHWTALCLKIPDWNPDSEWTKRPTNLVVLSERYSSLVHHSINVIQHGRLDRRDS